MAAAVLVLIVVNPKKLPSYFFTSVSYFNFFIISQPPFLVSRLTFVASGNAPGQAKRAWPTWQHCTRQNAYILTTNLPHTKHLDANDTPLSSSSPFSIADAITSELLNIFHRRWLPWPKTMQNLQSRLQRTLRNKCRERHWHVKGCFREYSWPGKALKHKTQPPLGPMMERVPLGNWAVLACVRAGGTQTVQGAASHQLGFARWESKFVILAWRINLIGSCQ